MSFLDPEKWDDVNDNGDPTDWSSRSNTLRYPAYSMLWRALDERLFVLTQQHLDEIGVPGMTVSLPEHRPQQIYVNLDHPPPWTPPPMLPRPWEAVFDYWFFYVMSGGPGGGYMGWVNYTLGDDFTGETDIPIWDSNLILADIGDPAWIEWPVPEWPFYLPRYATWKAAWAKQRYEGMNRMKWLWRSPSWGSAGLTEQETREGYSLVSQTDAIDLWDAASWVSSVNDIKAVTLHSTYPDWLTTATRAKASVDFPDYDGRKHVDNLYLKTVPSSPPSNVYNDFGTGLLEGVFNLVYTSPAPHDTANVTSDIIGDQTAAPNIWGGDNITTSYTVNTTPPDGGVHTVIKFDVEGGFKFQA